MLKDMRSWRENVREQSLRNFHHKAEWRTPLSRAALTAQTVARVAAHGYRSKVVEKENATLIAAKQGAINKWGYIFAHSSIVIICIGGLLDSGLPIRIQKMMFDKTPFSGSGLISEIGPQHRLGLGNPTFRGNTLIPEGGSSSTAIIAQENGVLIQDLPFTIRLKHFIIDYYTTGMPKLFASEVVVTDHETGKSFPATIKVNEPLIYRGVAVYQSSFEDGGSKLKLMAYPMQGEVGGSSPLNAGKADYTVEWSNFRAINVENMASNGQDVRAVNPKQGFGQTFSTGLEKHMGSAAGNARGKDLKNVGPSVQYKLRDKNGQAREYQNYMQPVLVDGSWVFLAGMRDSPSEPFRFMRIPADDNDTVDEWMRIRAALLNPEIRFLAAQRYAQGAMSDTRRDNDALRRQLQASALKGLTIFAGDGSGPAGYIAVSKFLERIPQQDQEKAINIFMKILNGSLWDVWQIAREKDGLKAVAPDDKHGRFLQLATNAYSDSFFYGAPVYLQLQGFDEVKASVLQVSRSPGKKVVYLGCLLLVTGVFSMFYIRERRLWVWIKSEPDGSARAVMAMSSQRKTLDFEKDFDVLRQQLQQPGPEQP
jgi:cytochrome c biogenesis protein